jgi:hypothetical protein
VEDTVIDQPSVSKNEQRGAVAVPTGSDQAPGMPRWVKVLVAVGIALVALIVVMLLTGHGPGEHMHHALPGRAQPAGAAVGGWQS